ncbi:hypothetical protein [Carnobacterium mobile]|uniref:hypothetical protein n=1 Tax=Carnobacterium mobile TaxID=2750 RepID=UPI0018691CFA|nr:hypothetical protein [Carnobacterium mobile]
MENDLQFIMSLGQSLKELVNSGIPQYAIQTINTVKEKRDDKKTIEAYEEVFTKLMAENQELKRISLAYKDAYEQINIDDKDIEYLQKTAHRIINIFFPELTDEDFKRIELDDNLNEQEKKEHITNLVRQRETYTQLTELIQVDTLRTMQLLGFNYKMAIGEPLTKIISNSLLNGITQDN